MIDEIDRTLEKWLRADVPLPVGDAELKFEQPEKTWDARRSIPMVNLFLYSVNKSEDRAMTGSRVVRGVDGSLSREELAPIVEARYLVSVWGGGSAVEHELLGRLVNLLASTKGIPVEHQTPVLRTTSPEVTISLEPDTVTSLPHLWSGLGVPPRPAIQLVVYSPMGSPVVLSPPAPPSGVSIGVNSTSPAYAPRRRVLATRASRNADVPKPAVKIEDSGRASPMRTGGPGD